MQYTNQDTVGQIVADDIRAADVFKKHGIDFCCGGGTSIQQACDQVELNPEIIIAEIEQALEEQTEETTDYARWSAAELCDYIEERHHTYVREKVPMLKSYAQKVAEVHGHHHPELVSVNEKVQLLATDLIEHLQKEEQILFPWIRTVQEQLSGSVQLPFGTFENPISVMEADHDQAGLIIKEIRALTKGFELPDYACNTWQAYFHLLTEFESDLFMHIHLENNVLHPKTRVL